MSSISTVPDVFTAREIAAAAGVSTADVRALMADGSIYTIGGRFVAASESVRIVRRLRGLAVPLSDRPIFGPRASMKRSPGALLASGALHGVGLLAFLLLATMGVVAPTTFPMSEMRLVFLATPGPGGGGGGGGLKQPAPPPAAKMKGASAVKSPVPPPRPKTTRPPEPEPKQTPPPPAPEPVAKPVEPPPPAPKPLPEVVAPVAQAPADTTDKAGILANSRDSDSHGPGTGAGAGTGQGTGIGEGTGSGIGPGTGGGTGGGPYRPGSGITPPSILREVRPDYTEEARRRGIAGDVELEIVVRADGTVGNVKVIRGLGSGLDQRAVDAVRQWRFSPAKRFGTPVDVLVEVAVEFKLR